MKPEVGKTYNLSIMQGDNLSTAVIEVIEIYSGNIKVQIHVDNGTVRQNTHYVIKPNSSLHPTRSQWEEVPSNYDEAMTDLLLRLGDKIWFYQHTNKLFKGVDNM